MGEKRENRLTIEWEKIEKYPKYTGIVMPLNIQKGGRWECQATTSNWFEEKTLMEKFENELVYALISTLELCISLW